jgi:iron complex outermembrane receptor protein
MRHVVFFLLAALLPDPGYAESRLEEVIVTAAPRERRVLPPTIQLDRHQIAERTPFSLKDILEALPSVGIRTNSRGETVLRLRGSEERQTSIFLDGAPLTVPWDGRVDLSSLPVGLVNSMQVTASAAPVEYGANSVLGVVDLRTAILAPAGLDSLQLASGTEGARSLSTTANVNTGPVDWLVGGSYRRLDGEAVSDASVIPYGQISDDQRINTDLESGSIFIAAGKEQSWGTARLSLLSVRADRGIANAGHIDPDVGSPRYWRYPSWAFDQLTLNTVAAIGDAMQLRSTAWVQSFAQTIEQYTDDTYSLLESTEDDEDLTVGLRLVLETPFPAMDLRFVGNAQTTQHDQLDTDTQGASTLESGTYQQNIFSLATEADFSPIAGIMLSTAISYDVSSTPKTGSHAAQDDLSDWAASIAAQWRLSDDWSAAATLGQRTRFPTLRELYGVALGSFLLNPDLAPETALLGDLTMESVSANENLIWRITPWILRIDGTLSHRNVDVDGLRLRQRYNLRGSKGHGLEIILDWTANDRLSVQLQGNWQKLEARREEDGTRPVLYQRPRMQAAITLDYLFNVNWDLFAELRYIGEALDEDEDSSVVKLPTATTIDLRLFRTLRRDERGLWRAYAGIDNVSDELVLPQLGLPQPGRTAVIGLQFDRF